MEIGPVLLTQGFTHTLRAHVTDIQWYAREPRGTKSVGWLRARRPAAGHDPDQPARSPARAHRSVAYSCITCAAASTALVSPERTAASRRSRAARTPGA